MEEFDERLNTLNKWTFPESITIKDLIDVLSTFPPDTKVCTTWESTINTLLKENVYMSKWGVVFIDADTNFYKKEYGA